MNKNEIKKISEESLLTYFLDKTAQISSQLGKEATDNLFAELLIDFGFSSVPGVSGIYQNLKLKREAEAIRQILILIEERIDDVNSLLKKMDAESRENVEQAFEYMYEYAVEEKQKEKITYMVNGFINLITLEKAISNEFIITYYDVLRELRMVDIAVLKYMYDLKFGNRIQSKTIIEFNNEIKQEFNIDDDQIISVRRNLERLGLLSIKYSSRIVDDLNDINDQIKNIKKIFESMGSGRRNIRLKINEVSIKSSNRHEVSKFGREFIEFFMQNTGKGE